MLFKRVVIVLSLFQINWRPFIKASCSTTKFSIKINFTTVLSFLNHYWIYSITFYLVKAQLIKTIEYIFDKSRWTRELWFSQTFLEIAALYCLLSETHYLVQLTKLKIIQSPSDSKSFWHFPRVSDSSWQLPKAPDSFRKFTSKVTQSYTSYPKLPNIT